VGDDPNMFSIVLVSQLIFSNCAIDLSFGYCTVVSLFCLEHVLIFNVCIDTVLIILRSHLLLLG
jgi:hypothetical protein